MNLSLHIEELIVDGLPLRSEQGPAFRAALQAELARLIEQRGLAGLSGGAVPALYLGNLPVGQGATPARLGSQLAQSLHAGLQPTPSPSRIP